MEGERIVKAAIRFVVAGTTEPVIMTGKRHGQIFQRMNRGKIERQKALDVQGFLTSAGRFVNRRTAARIAYNAGQTKELKEELLSEDVW